MGEPVKKGEYIGEYVGEVISETEYEQRGVVYDKRSMNYMFRLNKCKCSWVPVGIGR
jgi:histone-lysine N-methyltransferase EZH2